MEGTNELSKDGFDGISMSERSEKGQIWLLCYLLPILSKTIIDLMDHPNNLVSDSKVTGPEVKDQGHPEVIETLFNVDTIWIMLLCTV